MMERSICTSPYAAITMRPFIMDGRAQTLCYKAILKGKIGIPVHTDALIGTPGEGAVVHHDIFVLTDGQRIAFHLVLVSHTEAQEAEDDIAGFDDYRIAGNTDSVAGSRLPGHRKVTARNLELAFQMDCSRNIEDNRAGSVHLECLTERTDGGLFGNLVACVLERRDMYHDPFASTRDIFATTLRTGESRYAGRSRLIASASPTSGEAERESRKDKSRFFNRDNHSREFR